MSYRTETQKINTFVVGHTSRFTNLLQNRTLENMGFWKALEINFTTHVFKIGMK